MKPESFSDKNQWRVIHNMLQKTETIDLKLNKQTVLNYNNISNSIYFSRV